MPALCVCGSEDGSTPPDLVRELAALIPDSHFHLIAGAGHLPCVEQPATLSDMIVAFAEETGLA